MEDNLKLNVDDWGVKTIERSKGRMKLTFKLNREEAESFKNWMSVVRPPDVDDDRFYKTIFFHGVAFLNEQMQGIAEKEKERLEALEKQQAEIKANSEGGAPDPDIDVKVSENPLSLVKDEDEKQD